MVAFKNYFLKEYKKKIKEYLFKNNVIIKDKIDVIGYENLDLYLNDEKILKLIKNYKKILNNELIDDKEFIKAQEINKRIIERLKENFSDEVKEIINILKASKNSCIVGGSIRNAYYNKKIKDFDFCTDINFDDMIKMFEKEGFKIKEAGKHFLVLIISKNNKFFEIANFRKDGVYLDGRRPESVEIGNIEDDAKRRDFSINALYYNLNDEVIIDVIDYSYEDLINNKLRFIGNAKDRIEEDYLRVFRFYRFLNNFKELKADKNSLKAVRNLFDKAVRNSASERIREEIERMI